jgi:hypothetical protein
VGIGGSGLSIMVRVAVAIYYFRDLLFSTSRFIVRQTGKWKPQCKKRPIFELLIAARSKQDVICQKSLEGHIYF